MLESVIEKEDVAKLIAFGHESGLVPIGPHNDGNIAEAAGHHVRLVANIFPPNPHRAGRRYNHNFAAGSAVASRQDHRMKTAVAQPFCKGDHEWGFAGSAQREIANADDRMTQPQTGQNAGAVKPFTSVE